MSSLEEPVHLNDWSGPAPARLKVGHGRKQCAGIEHGVPFTGTHIAKIWAYCLLRHTALCRTLCMARTPDQTELRQYCVRYDVYLFFGLIEHPAVLVRYQPPPETAPLSSLDFVAYPRRISISISSVLRVLLVIPSSFLLHRTRSTNTGTINTYSLRYIGTLASV